MTDHGGGAGPGGPRTPDPDTVREEAERLVATGLAAVSMVADRIGAPSRERGGSVAVGYDALGDVLFGPAGHRRHSVANESAECCRCPVCRVISAARQPSPVVAERLATGVGTVAEGAARVLRGLAGAAGSLRDARPRAGGEPSGGGPSPAPEPPRPEPSPPRPTGPQPPRPGPALDRDTDPWAAATASPAAPPSVPTAAPAPVEPPAATAPVVRNAMANKAMAKKTVAKKTVAKKAASKKTVAKKAVAKKAVAKKAVAKKSATKKSPGGHAAPDWPATGKAGE